jgi:hypothetical protein
MRSILIAMKAEAESDIEGNGAKVLDRKAVVDRHRVRLHAPDLRSPLSVGNGCFCFTADVTGLQTFENEYAKGLPLCTMADWGWHAFPNPEGYDLQATMIQIEGTDGRSASYPINQDIPAFDWLRANPHQFNLGKVGLVLTRSDGTKARLDEIEAVDQQLDLWSGELVSRFRFDSQPVAVHTCALPDSAAVALRVESPLIPSERLCVEITFPYPTGGWGPGMSDWTVPERHETELCSHAPDRLELRRRIDAFSHSCMIVSRQGVLSQRGPHEFEVRAERGHSSFDVLIDFSENLSPALPNPDYEVHRAAAARGMQDFWMSGGAVDLSQSSDPRWPELERRIVLSQYLTAIQSRGLTCPQETGLTCNSWFGKFHLEMHWWHAVHFALWGRGEVLIRQLDWYLRHLPKMRQIAERQGYRGVRWGKMLDPAANESPSLISPLLIWQQPHPIYYAEQVYRIRQDRATLETYRQVVEQTADFMADFATWNEQRGCYELGPPFISAREFAWEQFRENKNGCFEIAYWRWGLETANVWRQRRGLAPNPEWEMVARSLAPLPIRNGVYIEQENQPVADAGHPTQLAAYGLLPPTESVQTPIMEKTLEHVLRNWDFEDTWGWDFPMIAMTAARMGRTEEAVEALLLDTGKNTFLPNGHNYQTELLPCYLPGNGGLLAAVAMMAAGWDGSDPSISNPGFGKGWSVTWEGLHGLI